MPQKSRKELQDVSNAAEGSSYIRIEKFPSDSVQVTSDSRESRKMYKGSLQISSFSSNEWLQKDKAGQGKNTQSPKDPQTLQLTAQFQLKTTCEHSATLNWSPTCDWGTRPGSARGRPSVNDC